MAGMDLHNNNSETYRTNLSILVYDWWKQERVWKIIQVCTFRHKMLLRCLSSRREKLANCVVMINVTFIVNCALYVGDIDLERKEKKAING